jgi:1-deoxy-D-xylulose-5-phosphate reductoisomerase
MNFEEPDLKRFPCLSIAKEVAKEDNTLPCVLNAANEVAVDAFLKGKIKFLQIAEQIQRVLDRHRPVSKPALDDILESDAWARKEAHSMMQALNTTA